VGKRLGSEFKVTYSVNADITMVITIESTSGGYNQHYNTMHQILKNIKV
jgi:hypothetical protein